MNGPFLTQVQMLAKRSLVRTWRQKPLLMQGIVFPLFIFAFNAGGLDLAKKVAGFPTDSYTTFALALTFTFCGIQAVTIAGTQMGEDIGTGFVRRPSLTQTPSTALLLGQLIGVVIFALGQAIVFVGVGLAFGAKIEAGPGGAVAIVALAGVYAFSLGTIGVLLALTTRSAEAVQSISPLFMAALFLSSLSLPRELIQTDWFQQVATYNPISYLVEAPRSLLIAGWDAQALLLGLLVAGSILLTGLLLTVPRFRELTARR